jgi:hypothetical protein
MFYVLRPVTDEGREVLANWERPKTRLEWSVVREADDLSLSLHGCDLVSDWERPSGWKLPKETRSLLHDDLADLFGQLPGNLELTAAWSDDPIDHSVDLSPADVLRRTLANEIANRTNYRIAAVGDVGSRDTRER